MLRDIIILLLVAACSQTPLKADLAVPVHNQAQLENDESYCTSEMIKRAKKAREDNRMNTLAIGIFGLLAVPAAAAEGTPDYNKSGREMFNECMTAKGYKLSNAN